MLKISSSHSVTRATIKLSSSYASSNLILAIQDTGLQEFACIESVTIREDTTRRYLPEYHPSFRSDKD